MNKQKIEIEFLTILNSKTNSTIEILDKLIHFSDDIAFGALLNESQRDFKDLLVDTQTLLAEYGKKPKLVGEIEGTASSLAKGIHLSLNTLFDKSTTRLAEFLLAHLLHNIIQFHKSKASLLEQTLHSLNNRFITLNEKLFEQTKKFL